MALLIIAALLAGALVAPVTSAQATTVTLKSGQDRMLGKHVTLRSMWVVGSERLKHIGATPTGEGCWSSPRTFYESCTVLTDCRVQGCWVGIRAACESSYASGAQAQSPDPSRSPGTARAFLVV